jgi:glycosyltransferase involved in cell wall biosynthesis
LDRFGEKGVVAHPGGFDMRICYVLAYRAPDYIRTRSLLAALRALPGVECYTAINSSEGLHRYRETLAQVAEIRRLYRPDLYLLGFRGHELYWPLKALVGNSPIILDAMMSPAIALAEEDQYGFAGRLAARMLTPVEGRILRNAAFVLTDTKAHADAFAERYRLSPDRLAAVPVGAVESAPLAQHPGASPRLRVLFYGSFLPLHGVPLILEAARELLDLPLDLDFIGANRHAEQQIKGALGRGRELHYRIRRWVPFESLIQTEIPAADLCLGGPFGNTPQARRVVTGKTSQALAQCVPTVVGAAEFLPGFVDQKNCLIARQGQPLDLVRALRWAFEHRERLPGIGVAGRRLYEEKLSLAVVAGLLGNILRKF